MEMASNIEESCESLIWEAVEVVFYSNVKVIY